MDAAPELISGSLLAVPVMGTNEAAQSISVAVDARRTLPRIAHIVADCLTVWCETMMPRAASKSSTIRRLSGKRR